MLERKAENGGNTPRVTANLSARSGSHMHVAIAWVVLCTRLFSSILSLWRAALIGKAHIGYSTAHFSRA